MSRRAAPGKRWSAVSSSKRWDAAGAELPNGEGVAAKVTVRYRLDNKGRKVTFSGPTSDSQANEFAALLVAAYAGDWPADAAHRPVPPAPLPVATAPPPDEPEPLTLPKPTVASGPMTVEDLAAWKLERHRTGPKKRTGTKRSPTTVGGYKNELDFAVEHLRYQPGDPRLAALGLEPGAPMLVDDPVNGVNESDLIALIDLRATTNLRTRGVNARRLSQWALAVATEDRLAASERREPVIPPRPELEAEVVKARTIESSCREVKGMFTDAYLRGRMTYQPWTSEVDDQIIRASPVVYNLRNVASPAQVDRLVATMATSTRLSVDATGKRVEASGARFAALVMLAGKKGLREEELGGLRRSWVELDRDRPRIVLRGAEVYHPLDDGGRQRVRVTLKHRPPGEIRIIDLSDTPDLVEALRSHLDLFCPRPDHESDAIDPLVFTTHRDTPIDFSNWVGAWWKPCAAATFTDPSEDHLRGLWFTRLRAAAITAWLIDGRTLEWCARQAGNSQAVIEKHYKGIIDEIGYLDRPTGPTPPPTALAAVDVAEMSVAELAAAQARLADELTRRAMAG